MPFDNFFKSGYKRSGRKLRRAHIAALYKQQWPEGSQNGPKAKLEMRGGGRDWWHFTDVPAICAEEEAEAWRRANPGYAFRVETPEVKKKPEIIYKEPRRIKRWRDH